MYCILIFKNVSSKILLLLCLPILRTLITYIIKKNGFLYTQVGFKRISKSDDFLCNQNHLVLNKYYKANGCVDIFKTSCLKNNSVSGKNIIPYIMDINANLDIDTLEDFKKIKKKNIEKFK
jgi:CMP-N-acetylneuraminic acid synthetase